MPDPAAHKPSSQSVAPDYAGLVRFLVEPFLELPESLRIDCEVSPSKSKVWVRLAFEGSDKGRVFGRGGRNIQAIRSVLEAAAQAAGHSAYLDVYGSQATGRNGGADSEGTGDRPQPRRSSGDRRPSRPRSQ